MSVIYIPNARVNILFTSCRFISLDRESLDVIILTVGLGRVGSVVADVQQLYRGCQWLADEDVNLIEALTETLTGM
jgi:hypothetical protein